MNLSTAMLPAPAIAAALLLVIASASAQKLIVPPATTDKAASATASVEDVRPVGPPITLGASGGTLLHLPGQAKTVFVADPDIADVQVQSPDFIYIAAKKPGITVLYAADAAGTVLLNRPVQVQFETPTIIRGATAGPGGQPAPGPIVLTIPLQQVAPAPR